MITLGNRLKELREEKEISQQEFASIMNIGNSTLSQYESDKRTPNDDLKMKIAEFFNVSMDYLMGLTDIKEPADKIVKRGITTIALHNTDGYDDDLPPEAMKELEEYKDYLRHKYGKKK